MTILGRFKKIFQIVRWETSPAEAAGLKEGDIVIAINKVFDQNLSALKASLQNTGDKVHIIVRRGKDLMEFEFKVRSIL